MDLWHWLVLSAVVVALLAWLTQPDPQPLLGIYAQAGKWYGLKFHLMKAVIAWRQSNSRKPNAKKDYLMASQFGSGGARDIREQEKKQSLPADKPNAADAVFFNAASKDGTYFTLGTAQRQNDIINLFFVFHSPELRGTFIVPEMLSDTNVKSVPSHSEWRTASGFSVRCLEPMRKWSISFKGELVKSEGQRFFTVVGPESTEHLSSAERVAAELQLEWNHFGDHFDFDVDVSPTSIAHSLAIQPWSRELFDKLKASHQSHYEQFGFLTGTARVGKAPPLALSLTSMRDHTITAHRDWAEIRRYIMMTYHLDDGTCIHTSLISMPEVVFSHLEFGYVVTPKKKKYAVDRIFLHLANVGERKEPFPRAFNYSFTAGPLHYDVQVTVLGAHSFKMGLKQATQVNEQPAKFIANGISGQGFVEAAYRISPY